jgi:hypothetical protein
VRAVDVPLQVAVVPELLGALAARVEPPPRSGLGFLLRAALLRLGAPTWGRFRESVSAVHRFTDKT